MARVASNPFGLVVHEFAPGLRAFSYLPCSRTALRNRTRPHKLPRLICEAKSNPVEPPRSPASTDDPIILPDLVKDDIQATAVPQDSESVVFPNKNINRRIALASTVTGVGLFLSSRLDFGISLKDLSAAATPYEEALSNCLPTVIEFYADWCEVCRELAPDVYTVEQQYKNRVNFVMLNVDNTKWEQELDEFGVEGIPHFAFLDRNGNEEGNVVGRLPRQYLLDNVTSLANGEPSIPHARVVGQYTSAEFRKVHQVADPRSHG